MARSYRFSVIQARPDRVRGERVNVGIIIEGEGGFDVRMPEVRKLAPLTGHRWDNVAEAYSEVIEQASNLDIDELVRAPEFQSDVFIVGKSGTLIGNSAEEYEHAVQKVMDLYVAKPKLSRAQKQERINAEISRVLKTAGVLSKKGETIDDHKVVPRFVISEAKEITADFAYKTDKLKIVSTLELRGAKSAHAKACEKGSTLYFAKEKYGDAMIPFGVYAASPQEIDLHRSEIEILKGFAGGKAFNWLNANDRRDFKSALY